MELPNNPTDKDIDEFNQKQLFVRDAMPDSWMDYSDNLVNAANELWSTMQLTKTVSWESLDDGSGKITEFHPHSNCYIFLIGIALENIIKGILIAQESRLISNGFLEKKLKTHKLSILIDQVENIRLDDLEYEVLSLCEVAIPYWGRYPVPLRYQDYKQPFRVDDGFRNTFEKLYKKLGDALVSLIENGWDSGVGPRISEYHRWVDLSE